MCTYVMYGVSGGVQKAEVYFDPWPRILDVADLRSDLNILWFWTYCPDVKTASWVLTETQVIYKCMCGCMYLCV